MYTVNRVLVPVDFSDISRAAISQAIQLCDRHGAALYLLYVDKDLDRELQRRIISAPNERFIEQGIDKHEKDLLETLELEYTRAANAGFNLRRAKVHLMISGGAWLDVALQMIESEQIDVVVSGTHGRKGIAGLILGSVTEQLVARATCSVFVVKPNGYPYLRD